MKQVTLQIPTNMFRLRQKIVQEKNPPEIRTLETHKTCSF